MHQEKVHFINFGNLKFQEAQHSLHHFHPSLRRRHSRVSARSPRCVGLCLLLQRLEATKMPEPDWLAETGTFGPQFQR